LQTIGSQIGTFLFIDTIQNYTTKMLGSWIKATVENLENLPIILILPKMDKKMGSKDEASSQWPSQSMCEM